MGDRWLDVLALACCLTYAAAAAAPPPTAPRIRRLRCGTWAIVRLRRWRR